MKDMSWIEMMKKAQEIRLFTSLQIKRAQKGGITSAQELDLLSRIVLSDAELTPLELTVLTGLSKSAVSRLIEHLERKELLQKKYNSMINEVIRSFVLPKEQWSWKRHTSIIWSLFIGFEKFSETKNSKP